MGDPEEICGKCEQIWVLCDCEAYCETCGKHQERCLCYGDNYDNQEPDESEPDEDDCE